MIAPIVFLSILIVFPGCVGIAIFGYYALIDYQLLNAAYKQFALLADNSSNLLPLFKANAQQNIHRLNLFADGTWALLSYLVATVGVIGIFLLLRRVRL